MSQLAFAFLLYNDAHGKLPPAVVYGKNGQPLYSWRVLLLPHLEEDELYKQFDLDEPWDSPRNIQLLSRMPRSYQAPGSKAALAPPNCTFFHVFVGKGTAFESRDGESLKGFTDGISGTIMLVEGGEPVPWSKPEDIPYAADQPLPNLATVFRGGFRVAMADGHMVFIKGDTSDATIRALITRNGGDKPGPDWFGQY